MNERLREFERASGLDIYGLGARREKWEKALEKFAILVIEDYENDLRESRREVKSELGYSRIGRNNV